MRHIERASHIFSPNRPLCVRKQNRSEQKPLKCNAHKAQFLRGLKAETMLDFCLQSIQWRQTPFPFPSHPNLGFMAKTAIRGLDWRNIWPVAAASVSHSLCLLRERLNNVRRRRQNAEKFESPRCMGPCIGDLQLHTTTSLLNACPLMMFQDVLTRPN